ncbi:hypothetical protein DFJ77DRAFT_437578 [Powellomyces hirtus]|nr:hypothetical protein DFJ77DRAFT_437578 [Powellomyces hirtus]
MSMHTQTSIQDKPVSSVLPAPEELIEDNYVDDGNGNWVLVKTKPASKKQKAAKPTGQKRKVANQPITPVTNTEKEPNEKLEEELHFRTARKRDFTPPVLSESVAFSLVEYIHFGRVRAMLKSPGVPEETKSELRQLKRRQVHKNGVTTSYAYAANAVDNSGRLWAQGPALQNMDAKTNNVRQYLAAGKLGDLDQVNSVFYILAHLLKTYSIKCPNVDEYIAYRAEILKREKVDKESVMYLLNYKPRKVRQPFFAEIHRVLYEKLVPHLQKDYPALWAKTLASRKPETMRNREGSFFTKVSHTLENKITLAMKEFLEENDWKVSGIVFDGLMFHKRDDKEMTPDVLLECDRYVKEKTGIVCKVAEKPMDVTQEFLDRFQLTLTPVDTDEQEEEDEPFREKESKKDSKGKLDYSRLNKLPKWRKFPWRRVTNPSHKNLAEWYFELRNGAILKHQTAGYIYVLGKDNVWRQFESVRASDLNLQVADSLVQEFHQLIQDVSDDGQEKNVRALQHLLNHFQDELERESFSLSVTNNVGRMADANDNCVDLFLSKPELLAFNDGVYNLQTKEFRAILPKDYILHSTGYDFPKGPRNDTIRKELEAFFSSIYASTEVRDYRMRAQARALYGRVVEEIYMVLKGEGRNGKGAEDYLIKKVFGGYYFSISPNNLTGTSRNVDAPNAQMFNIFGKRYISTSEPKGGEKMNTEEIKKLTGNDPYTVRTLHSKPISFPVTGLLNIQTNNIVKWDKVDTGLVLRSRCCEYPYTFEPADDIDADDEDSDSDDGDAEDADMVQSMTKPMDMTLKARFGRTDYRNECLFMYLDIFQDIFVRDNKFDFTLKAPDAVATFTRQNLVKSLTIGTWFENTYTITGVKNDRVLKSSIYEAYVASRLGQETVSLKIFHKELAPVLPQTVKRRGNIYVVGLTMNLE